MGQVLSGAVALPVDLLGARHPCFPEQVPAPPQGLLCRWKATGLTPFPCMPLPSPGVGVSE